MAKKESLGRGLDALFAENTPTASQDTVVKLRISQVEPKQGQPRLYFDEESLSELANSIAENGVIQPILVRETESGMYEIIAGERRWRASKMAGLTEIPALVLEADELKTARLALIENIQRKDLSVYEEALAYHTLIAQFGLTQEALADSLGKSRSAVTNTLRLLELPDPVLHMLQDGRLSAGHCRALQGLKNRSLIVAMADRVVAHSLSVRETEAAVRAQNQKRTKPPEEAPTVRVNYVEELEHRVTSLTGRRCKISAKGSKKTLSIEYTDDADLEALLEKVCGQKVIED